MGEGDYRDELAAAHARIAELETELAERSNEAGGRGQPWIAELEAKRAKVLAEAAKGMGDPRRRWRIRWFVIAIAFVLAAALSLIVGGLWPFLLFGFLTLHPTMLVIWAIGKGKAQRARFEVAKIDEKIDDVRRMAALMGPTRTRVALPGREVEEAEEEPAHAASTHQGRSSR